MQEHLNSLGLDPSKRYSPEEIKKAWRKKAAENHPDRGGDQDEFLKVTHAYKMLTDPTYRHSEERRVNPHQPDLTIRMQIPVTFEEAFFGRPVNICFNRIELDDKGTPVHKKEQELIAVDFELPQGCLDGHEIIKKGMGLKRGTMQGDLVIRVVPTRHPRFQHNGPDIITQEKVPLDIILKGGDIEVQTMYGLKTLKVPPGTQPGSRLAIKKCGVSGYGDHIVIVDPVFPQKDDLKKEAWKGLDINWEGTPESEDEEFEQQFIRIKTFRF